MSKDKFLWGSLAAILVGIAWGAVSYAGFLIAEFPFLPFEWFEWLVRVLSGKVVTAGLEFMIGALQSLQLGPTDTLGKAIEAGMALALTAVAFAFVGGSFALIAASRAIRIWLPGVMAGLLLMALSLPVAAWAGWGSAGAAIGAAWFILLSLGWGLGVAWIVAQIPTAPDSLIIPGRRRFLRDLGLGSLALSGLALGIGKLLGQREQKVEVLPVPTSLSVHPPDGATVPRFQAVEGTRQEVTPIEEFYRVDINLLPPTEGQVTSESAGNLAAVLRAQGAGELKIAREGYALLVDGLVGRHLVLSLDQLREFPSVSQYATLECISNRVAGDLISNTLFTGVRLRDVLQEADPQAGAEDIKFTCADGYTESLPIEWAMDKRTLLCYAMGRELLTEAHGAPLRLYTPDRFGMKNPKWIVRIEAVGEDYLGYWQQRGWSEQAWVQTTSVSDVAISPRPGIIECSGIAFAGARGIQRVEVQLDDGEWLPVELKGPLSPLTWVLWRTTLEASEGNHKLTVRAIDGIGALQTSEVSPTQPNGATGYHSRVVRVMG